MTTGIFLHKNNVISIYSARFLEKKFGPEGVNLYSDFALSI
jgi:hypothetical protein